jgi:hypothetical protein
MLQLHPPIWVVTPKGEGFAIVLIDYGPHLNSVWLVHLFESGEVIHVDSAEIRVGGNEMYDIPDPKPFTERNI